jgi:hypothetical protein
MKQIAQSCVNCNAAEGGKKGHYFVDTPTLQLQQTLNKAAI